MPKFMRSIQIPVVSNPPVPVSDQVIIYGSDSGLNQATTAGDKNFDLAGSVVEFSFADVSPIFIGKSQLNLSIGEVIIEILTPFNNIATTITVGDSGDNSRLFTSDGNDPSDVGKYSCDSDYVYSTEEDIYLYIDGVNTSGSGVVRVYFN